MRDIGVTIDLIADRNIRSMRGLWSFTDKHQKSLPWIEVKHKLPEELTIIVTSGKLHSARYQMVVRRGSFCLCHKS